MHLVVSEATEYALPYGAAAVLSKGGDDVMVVHLLHPLLAQLQDRESDRPALIHRHRGLLHETDGEVLVADNRALVQRMRRVSHGCHPVTVEGAIHLFLKALEQLVVQRVAQ